MSPGATHLLNPSRDGDSLCILLQSLTTLSMKIFSLTSKLNLPWGNGGNFLLSYLIPSSLKFHNSVLPPHLGSATAVTESLSALSCSAALADIPHGFSKIHLDLSHHTHGWTGFLQLCPWGILQMGRQRNRRQWTKKVLDPIKNTFWCPAGICFP